jgi:hypothetical protein
VPGYLREDLRKELRNLMRTALAWVEGNHHTRPESGHVATKVAIEYWVALRERAWWSIMGVRRKEGM